MKPDFNDWVALPGVFDPRWSVAAHTFGVHAPEHGPINAWVNENIADAPAGPWRTPVVTLATRLGSCMDKATLKRAMLLDRGADPAQLYVIVGRDQILGEHAILWFHGEILDSVSRDDQPKPASVYGSIFEPQFAYGVDAWFYGKRSS